MVDSGDVVITYVNGVYVVFEWDNYEGRAER